MKHAEVVADVVFEDGSNVSMSARHVSQSSQFTSLGASLDACKLRNALRSVLWPHPGASLYVARNVC